MLKLANWLWAFLKNGDAFNSLEVIETHKNIAKSRGDEMDWERMGGKEIENAWLTLRTFAPSILNYVRRHLYFKSITQLATGSQSMQFCQSFNQSKGTRFLPVCAIILNTINNNNFHKYDKT